MTSTPTHRARERLTRAGRLAGAAVAALALLLTGSGSAQQPARLAGAAAWQGFVDGERSEIAVGQRVIVVLRYPSLADQVAAAGGQGSETQMRRWTAAAIAAQKQIAARLSREGVRIEPEHVYTRTLNGFAAALDARAVALLERDRDVVGVYPVRVAYPAAAARLPHREYVAGEGRAAPAALPGFDGAGITIALLDTGIDARHPYLRGRMLQGIDILEEEGRARARAHPDDPVRLEQHATQLAGLLVGRRGPHGAQGVAPGARLLPIRIAGWQPNAEGGHSVYGRTDQLLAGLERAVDPNADGSTLDAARVAVVGVAEPFAAFSDGPLALAAAGAARLDTLLVAPAGNDGPAGPGYGSIAGPGGAPAALTVAAADTRARTATARVVVRAGLRVLLDDVLPLGGSIAPEETLTLRVARPPEAARRPASPVARFFDAGGFSIVAGRAALVARTGAPAETAALAVRAGAAAVLLEGAVPPGAVGLDDSVSVPVVGLRAGVSLAMREALAGGVPVVVSLGAPSWRANAERGTVAAFSSHGLAFGGGAKPELAAPGVELLTAEAGRARGGAARYGTISGTSAAAALVGGAAAVVAQARPSLDAEALKGVLVGTAVPLPQAPGPAQGRGLVDPVAAAAAELAAVPAAVSFGAAVERGWSATRRVVVRNVSSRRVTVNVAADVEGVAGVSVTAEPVRVRLRAGQRAAVTLTARMAFRPQGVGSLGGVVRLESNGGGRIAVPWTVALPAAGGSLLRTVQLSAATFRASDQAPAVLNVRAGAIGELDGRRQLEPVDRLDVELWRGNARVGLLARLRNVLPGTYAFGITGRDPGGDELEPGAYRLRVVAVPPVGEPEAKAVAFRIRGE